MSIVINDNFNKSIWYKGSTTTWSLKYVLFMASAVISNLIYGKSGDITALNIPDKYTAIFIFVKSFPKYLKFVFILEHNKV